MELYGIHLYALHTFAVAKMYTIQSLKAMIHHCTPDSLVYYISYAGRRGCGSILYMIQTLYYIIRLVSHCPHATLREEPSHIDLILQQKLPAAKFSTVCTIHKQ